MITIRTYKDYIVYRSENDTRVFRKCGFIRVEVHPDDIGYLEAIEATDQGQNDVHQ